MHPMQSSTGENRRETVNSTYGWLYQKYAYPLLEKQREKAQEEMKALCRECGLDPEQQLTFTDQMLSLIHI